MYIKSLVDHVRFYSEGCSYEEKSMYDAILTVVWLDDNTVSIQGLKGTFSKERRDRLISTYKGLGVTKMLYERRGNKVELDI